MKIGQNVPISLPKMVCYMFVPEESVTTPTSTRPRDGISVSYKLPTFPADIAAALSAGQPVTGRGDRARILQVLYDDIWARVGL